jgi:hypothetical protein
MERRPSNRHPGGAFSCWACRFRPNGAWPRRPPVPTPWAGGRAPPVASSTRHHAAVRCGNTPTVPVLDHRVVVQTTGAGLRGLASTSLIQPWRGRAPCGTDHHGRHWPSGRRFVSARRRLARPRFQRLPKVVRWRGRALAATASSRPHPSGGHRAELNGLHGRRRDVSPRSSRRPFAGRHAFCCVEVRVCCIPDPA